jgi:hypothetical protein
MSPSGRLKKRKTDIRPGNYTVCHCLSQVSFIGTAVRELTGCNKFDLVGGVGQVGQKWQHMHKTYLFREIRMSLTQSGYILHKALRWTEISVDGVTFHCICMLHMRKQDAMQIRALTKCNSSVGADCIRVAQDKANWVIRKEGISWQARRLSTLEAFRFMEFIHITFLEFHSSVVHFKQLKI